MVFGYVGDFKYFLHVCILTISPHKSSLFLTYFPRLLRCNVGIDSSKNIVSLDCLDTNSNILFLASLPDGLKIIDNSNIAAGWLTFLGGPYTSPVESCEITTPGGSLPAADPSMPTPSFSGVFFRVYGDQPGDNYQISTTQTNGGRLIGG